MPFKKINLDGTIKKQRGAIVIMAAVLLLLLLSFVALAINTGYLLIIRNELQNGADAAALAGANYLYPPNGTAPNWNTAQTKANEAIPLNKAENKFLANRNDIDRLVTFGYWNITGSPKGLQPTTITPSDNNLPAVQVTIRKASGGDNGAISIFFANVLGIASVDAMATAVSVTSSPGTANSPLMPFAIPQCIYESTSLWSSNGVPVPNNTITLGSIYTSNPPTCGNSTIPVQWTSFDSGAPSNQAQANRTIRTLIDQATGVSPPPNPPRTLSIGNPTWIQSGTEANLYSTGSGSPQTSVNGCAQISAGSIGSCAYAMVPVVHDVLPDGNTPIVGFACLHILSADGTGNPKTISVQLVQIGSRPECTMSGSGGIGPNYGVIQPPRLANYYGNAY